MVGGFIFFSLSWELLDKMQQNMKPLFSCLLGGFDAVLIGLVVPDI